MRRRARHPVSVSESPCEPEKLLQKALQSPHNPGLAHCSAFGETPEAALAEVLKALGLWLEAARAEGKPVPPPLFRPAIYKVA